jgi:hypothetical protein
LATTKADDKRERGDDAAKACYPPPPSERYPPQGTFNGLRLGPDGLGREEPPAEAGSGEPHPDHPGRNADGQFRKA